MKAQVIIHPFFGDEDGRRWVVVCYNGRGEWVSGSICDSKGEAQAKQRRIRRMWKLERAKKDWKHGERKATPCP